MDLGRSLAPTKSDRDATMCVMRVGVRVLRHLNLNPTGSTTLPTFVNDPLVDGIVRHLGLRDHLFPVLLWHLDWLT